MKSIGALLAELGFNPEAPLDTQKAFLKHLVKAAEANSLKNNKIVIPKESDEPVQMEFSFEDSKKVS